MGKKHRDKPFRNISDPNGRADWLRVRGEGHVGFAELLRPGSTKRVSITRRIETRKRWTPRRNKANTVSARQQPVHPAPIVQDVALSVPVPSQRTPVVACAPSRDGQAAFRAAVLDAYGKCAVTGCRDRDALQAAHVIPYVDERSHVLSNCQRTKGNPSPMDGTTAR